MDSTIIVAAIAAFAAITGAIISFANSRHIRQVEVNINGKLAALVEATGRAERAEGMAEGRVVEAAAVAALLATPALVIPVIADSLPEVVSLVMEGDVRATLTPKESA